MTNADTLEAKVFFDDGHTEIVLFHTYTQNIEGSDKYLDKHFKFRTESGLYRYDEYINIIPVLYRPNKVLHPFKHKENNFWKYDIYKDEWMVAREITKIEFYGKEVEQNDR